MPKKTSKKQPITGEAILDYAKHGFPFGDIDRGKSYPSKDHSIETIKFAKKTRTVMMTNLNTYV